MKFLADAAVPRPAVALRLHLLTNIYPPQVLGGYELLASDVVHILRKVGHHVTVVTTGTPSAEDRGVLRHLRLARPFGSEPSRDRLRHALAAIHNRVALSKILRQGQAPDAVLVMSLRRLGLEPLRVYGEYGVPSVLTVNDDWPVAFAPHRSASGLVARARRQLDFGPWARHSWFGVQAERVVYLSSAIRRLVLDAGAPLPEGVLCAQGVDTEHFARRPFRPIPSAPRLLFVGRLHPAKAPDVAIDTLLQLRQRGVDAQLSLAGAPVSAEYEAELRARAKPAGSAVQFLGHVRRPELPKIYAAADVALYPLRWNEEAQGLTYMEAIATGVPVVAFPTSGALELMGDHDVVERTASCDGEAFANAVQRLQQNPQRQGELVERAYSWLQANASLQRYTGCLEAQLKAAAGMAARPDAAQIHSLAG